MMLAVLSAATFGSSGPFAKSLLDVGWSPGATVLVRVGGAAAVLLIPTLIALRGHFQSLRDQSRSVLLYGIVAVAGAQVCFFNAVQYLTVGVALLLEYLAPVLLVGLAWARSGQTPGARTLAGTAVAMVGLVLVLDIGGTSGVDPLGVAWGLAAAICLSGYFLMSARSHDGLPPVVLAGGGLLVGTVAIAVVGTLGILPLSFSTASVTLLERQVNWMLPVLFLVVISTVVAYVTGIVAAAALGSRAASFVGLTEVLFAVLAAWLLLGELPVVIQLFGGLGILAGVGLVHADPGQADGLTADPASAVSL
ncbi:MAG: EamA family transporter [Euzebya sp.]